MATGSTTSDIVPKEDMKILVVGRNKCGKSSLINALVGEKITSVGDSVNPNLHDGKLLIERICSKYGMTMRFYDTRGFKDYDHRGRILIPDSMITDTIVTDMRSADVVLICHKLLEENDKDTSEILQSLSRCFDDGMIERCIFVFTFGDEGADGDDGDDNYLTSRKKKEMIEQMERKKEELKDILSEMDHLKRETIDAIPSCITCGKEGDNKRLPTSDNWVDDLWKLIRNRCKHEARDFSTDWLWKRKVGGLLATVNRGVENGVFCGTLFGWVTGAVVGGLLLFYLSRDGASTILISSLVGASISSIGSIASVYIAVSPVRSSIRSMIAN